MRGVVLRGINSARERHRLFSYRSGTADKQTGVCGLFPLEFTHFIPERRLGRWRAMGEANIYHKSHWIRPSQPKRICRNYL